MTCSARRIASNTSDTVGSSTHAANHGSDHGRVPADANPCTLVIVNASPSTIPHQHIQSTCDRTRSIRNATTSGCGLIRAHLSRLSGVLRQPLSPVSSPTTPRREVSDRGHVNARVSAYDANTAGSPSTASSSHGCPHA